MVYSRLIKKLLLAYLATGLFGFGLSSAYLLLTNGNISEKSVNLLSILIWPYYSIISSKALFGPEGFQIYFVFNAASVALFTILVIMSFERRY